MPNKTKRESCGNGELFAGSEITGDRLEFIMAMYAEQERLKRALLPEECLRVAVRIGYRKVAEPTPLKLS